uniref:Uncharacterized protein n=1 Tax=Rhizophora mucronata TaxID=61149 RepID=A0A2P2JZR6_RHIMU
MVDGWLRLLAGAFWSSLRFSFQMRSSASMVICFFTLNSFGSTYASDSVFPSPLWLFLSEMFEPFSLSHGLANT